MRYGENTLPSMARLCSLVEQHGPAQPVVLHPIQANFGGTRFIALQKYISRHEFIENRSIQMAQAS